MKITYILYCLIFIVTFKLYAEDVTETEDALHSVAHFGATYAMTHIGEVVCKKATNQSKLICTLESALLANAVNIGRKAMQNFPEDTKQATIAGIAGSATAAFVITIDW